MHKVKSFSKYLTAITLILICSTALGALPELSKSFLAPLSNSILSLNPAINPRKGIEGQVTVIAAGRGLPYINLSDGKEIVTGFAGPHHLAQSLLQGQSRPLAIAAGDFDRDGTQDLICGYGGPAGGLLALYRGDVDSIYPNTPEAIARRGAEKPGAPATTGFLPDALVVEIPQIPELLAAGDFDADGKFDIVAAQQGGDSLCLMSGDGEGGFQPALFIPLPGRITALHAGELNRPDNLIDLAVATTGAAGPQLLVFENTRGAFSAEPETFDLSSEATSLASGRLDEDHFNDLAVASAKNLLIVKGRDRSNLSIDGREHLVSNPTTTSLGLSFVAQSIAVGDFSGDSRADIAVLSSQGSLFLLDRANRTGGPAKMVGDWTQTEMTDVAWPTASGLVCARLSDGGADDLLVQDKAGHRINILASDNHMAPVSLDVTGEPVAVLPMRLNGDAFSDLVVLNHNSTAPSVALTAPLLTFTVTTTANGGAGSLEQAILDANSNAGADMISFNIPGTGPHTIMPTNQLPFVFGAVTIDGTTQSPGSGTPQIVINGASQTGGSGLTVLAASTTIRGLVINSFKGTGLDLSASSCIVEGNFIGTNAAGTAAQGNFEPGITINQSANTIGGTTAAARNVISGNVGNGILIANAFATANQVRGNFIGTTVSGASQLGNGSDNISIVSASGNTIGGTDTGAGNTIASSAGLGIRLLVASTTMIQGNRIGTNAAGTADFGNEIGGIDILDGANNTIGGGAAGAGNQISGNGFLGLSISGSPSTGNLIKGNLIGVQSNGVSALGNDLDGVSIGSSAANTTVGGASGEGNLIAFNGRAGVFVGSGTGHSIQNNSIFSNAGLGIDLGPVGVTANDNQDVDSGANGLQNFPVLTAASTSGGGSNVQGTLNSTPSSSFTLHFYTSANADPSGFGEGQTFLDTAIVNTDGAGNASFNLNFAASVTPGHVVTATATNGQGSTSEFSQTRAITGSADLSVVKLASPNPVTVGSNITYTITVANNGPDTASSVTVTDNLPATTTFVSCNSTGGGLCGGSGNNRTVTFPSMGSGTSAVITLVTQVNCNVANGTTITNTATVSSLTPDSGSGNNSSMASVTANNPAPTIAPTNQSFPASGGNGSFNLTIPAGCPWTAVSNNSFITITSGGSGTGNGTIFYSVALNNTGNPRMGTISVAGLTFTVNQSNVNCTYSISPMNASHPAGGGSGNVDVMAGAGCLWKALSQDDWITVTAGGNGSGNGTFSYSVEPNGGAARTGTIDIEGQTFTVNQSGAGGCGFSISPGSSLFAQTGGEGSVTVNTSTGCNWTAVSNASWINISSGDSGSGSGTVNYIVRDNMTGSPRQGTMTIAGLTFTVVQRTSNGAVCSFALSPTSEAFQSTGGTGSVTITVQAHCAWRAASSVPWLTVTSVDVGIGNGSIMYSVAANPGPSGRTGVITIGNQSFKVKQKGN
ncbi:MAG TPA: BACON domain-containing carbohydrate-binding protein [Blastocatellia bacterium]|nr:BACON domain-containing carbohydrate-binding protein [Blastocatellia bacterium]